MYFNPSYRYWLTGRLKDWLTGEHNKATTTIKPAVKHTNSEFHGGKRVKCHESASLTHIFQRLWNWNFSQFMQNHSRIEVLDWEEFNSVLFIIDIRQQLDAFGMSERAVVVSSQGFPTRRWVVSQVGSLSSMFVCNLRKLVVLIFLYTASNLKIFFRCRPYLD